MQIQDWLSQTTAADVMTRNVRSFRPDDTLAGAAEIMMREQLSGGPVVDSAGVCLGVLTMVDLLQAEGKVAQQQLEVAESPYFSSGLSLPEHIYLEQLAEVRDRLAPTAEHPVSEFMIKDLVSVDSATPVETVIRYMIDAHLHRVVVVNDQQHLLGLITMTDLLAALFALDACGGKLCHALPPEHVGARRGRRVCAFPYGSSFCKASRSAWILRSEACANAGSIFSAAAVGKTPSRLGRRFSVEISVANRNCPHSAKRRSVGEICGGLLSRYCAMSPTVIE